MFHLNMQVQYSERVFRLHYNTSEGRLIMYAFLSDPVVGRAIVYDMMSIIVRQLEQSDVMTKRNVTPLPWLL